MHVKPLFQKLLDNPVVLDTSVVRISVDLLRPEHAAQIASLYRRGYEAGEFYGTNWPRGEIFDPRWIEGLVSRPDTTWLVMTHEGRVVGATALFETPGRVLSDETYVSADMRGRRILPTLFAWMFEHVGSLQLVIEGEIVLGPHTGSMRKILQTAGGWVSLGIKPNALGSGKTSLLVVRRYPEGWKMTGRARVAPAFGKIYDIAMEQMGLPPADVADGESRVRMQPSDSYREKEVDAANPTAQADAAAQGFVPVAFLPEKMAFLVARFPLPADFGFLHNEAIAANKKLADYFGWITASGPASRTSLSL